MSATEVIFSMFFSGGSPGYMDIVVSSIVLIAAVTGWFASVISGIGYCGWRVLSSLGWSVLFTRFAWAFWIGDDPVIPPASSLAVVLVGAGYTLASMEAAFCDAFHRGSFDRRASPRTVGQ